MELSLSPERSLGPFTLGSPLGEVMEYVVQNGLFLRSNQLLFDSQHPLDRDLCLVVTQLGLQLRFCPRTQRLALIDVYDLSKVRIQYRGTKCGSEEPGGAVLPPTYQQLYGAFGPTFPGKFLQEKKTYLLQYPGVCFVFSLQLPVGSETNAHLPMEHPDGSSPVAVRALVHYGSNVSDRSLPSPEQAPGLASKVILSHQDMYYQPVLAHLKDGITLTALNLVINRRTSAQDLLVDLGKPNSTWVKQKQESIKIHSLTNEPLSSSGKDYMYNYFLLGLDFLLDGGTHRVKKIILHSNLIGSSSFGRYRKCNFRLETRQSTAELARQPTSGENERKEAEAKMIHKAGSITVDSTFSDIEKLFGKAGRPMVNNRSSASNPFGATLVYAYDGVLFQVTSKGLLVDVTLFGL